jgi:hypothetical protein
MRKACITTTNKQISRFLRMNLEGLMLELRWETNADQRAFLAREIAFNLAMQLRFSQGVIPSPGVRLARIMHHRLATVVADTLPGDTVYLSAFAPKGVLRWAESRCRFLKVEARRGRVRIGVCIWLDSRGWEPIVERVASRKIGNVSLVLPVVTTLRASDALASLAGNNYLCERQHG